jgi:hypothetical protein
MGCEAELVTDRPCDLPGCAASADLFSGKGRKSLVDERTTINGWLAELDRLAVDLAGSPPAACRRASTPTAAATTSIRCRRTVRSTRDRLTQVGRSGRWLQLPASTAGPYYVKARFRVREYPNGSVAVFHGPQRIARYTAQGDEMAAVPAPPKRDAVLAAVKAGPGDCGARGTGTATTILDGGCARRHWARTKNLDPVAPTQI